MSSLCPLRTNLGAFKFSILKQTREDHLAKSFCFADCSTGKMEQFQVSTILLRLSNGFLRLDGVLLLFFCSQVFSSSEYVRLLCEK